MNKSLLKIAFIALAIGNSSVVHAGDSADFSGCDGLKKPKKKDDGMRGVATIQRSYSFVGGTGKSAYKTISSCDRALSNKKLLPKQTLRRAHLLRARAAANLSLNKPEEALVDLNDAKANLADFTDDLFLQRSMGVSLMLLEAMVNTSLGNNEEAVNLAEQAAKLRPYARQVQLASAMIKHSARPIGEKSPAPWDGLLRISPDFADGILLREAEIGNFQAVARVAETVNIKWPEKAPTPYLLLSNNGLGSQWMNSLISTMHIAYAKAAIGESEEAERHIATITEKLESVSSEDKSENQILTAIREKMVNPYLATIEARIALSKGENDKVITIVSDEGLAQNAATLELMNAISQSEINNIAALVETELLTEKLKEDRNAKTSKIAELVLIAPESKRSVVDYEKSRPNILGALIGGAFSLGTSLLGGIDRRDGFRSEQNDDGTMSVEFVGNTTSGPMVQEMTLLRAAELAQGAGRSEFVIVNRNDYARYLISKQYGVEVSRVPTGYKTELKVRFLDEDETDEAMLNSLQLIDDLGPFYYGN